MATIESTLQLQDSMSAALINSIRAINVVGFSFTLAGEGIRQFQNNLRSNGLNSLTPPVPPPSPGWQSAPSMPVFTNSGADRFADEYREADRMANQLYTTQIGISAMAGSMSVAPPGMQHDMAELETRMQALFDHVQSLNQIPVELRTEQTNTELEKLRGLLGQANEAQTDLSSAMSRMDISAANEAYMRLNTIVNNTERDIRDNFNEQGQFNQSIGKGIEAAAELGKQLQGPLSKVSEKFSLQNIMQLSDSVTQTMARLDSMNDGLQTTENLNEKIFASAQRARTSYRETADVIANMGINAGNAFDSNDELIAFVEQVNKQFAIGGASTQQQSDAMEQLTQAMAAGTIQGEELNSILNAAPGIAGLIEQSMGWASGSIREYAENGAVSAQVIKNALFGMADETNEKFNAMPATFGQMMTMIKDTLLEAFWPLIEIVGQGATLISDNWSIVEPVIYGVAAGVLFLALATKIADLAASDFFITLLSNPLMQIAIIIGIIVAVIYSWVQSVGGLQIAWMMVVNAVLTRADQLWLGILKAKMNIQNGIDGMVYSFKCLSVSVLNALGDLKSGGLMILQNFVNGAVSMINQMIEAVNKITGIGIEPIGWVADFGTNAVQEEAEERSRRAEELAAAKDQLDQTVASRQSQYDNQERHMEAERMKRLAEIAALQNDAAAKAEENDLSSYGAGGADDPLINLPGDAGSTAVNTGSTAANTGNTAANTAAMADSMDIIDEDLKYMRDAAEQEIINRFTLAELKVDVSNNNTLKTQSDFNDVNRRLGEVTSEILAAAAEGGHF